jgi:Tol biopolymer transport system component
MGEVYRARDARLGREVAIKVLPVELSSDAGRLKRFEKEARSASALNHPNIVTIYEVGSHDSNSYIAMELVGGKTLRELLLPGGLPMKRAIPIAAQVAEGLARAHEAGIVHRDLKPENLMVTRDGLVKILDFGLAKLISTGEGSSEITSLPTETGTEAGVVLGTVGYMSPEQASGQPADHRSDQFSFGSILYEIACGRRAFQKKTTVETLTAIIREEPEPIGKVRPEIPPPLRWIVERCLAKDPEERYVSTRDLARDLASVRDHVSEVTSGAEPSVALGPRPLARLRRWTVLAAALLLLLFGAVVGWLAAAKRLPRASAPTFRRLTFRSGQVANARFTPDGQTVVYGAWWTGEPRGLYAARPESPESRSFDMQADILAISRSGEMAVLLNDNPLFGGTLARVPFAGGVPRPSVEGVPYAGADWSPDGKELAIVRNIEGRSRLEFPVGKVLHVHESEIGGPRFSPRGDLIAFQDEAGSIDVIPSSGGNVRTISTGWVPFAGGAPCWTPDGKEIWFTASAEPGQPSGLHAVDLAGKVRLVAQMPGELELDDISRDGRVLLAHHTFIYSLWGLAPGDSVGRNLTWLDQAAPSDLSPDGKTILFSEIGEGGGKTGAVYLRNMDGSPAVRLGEGQGLALSPDGKWVLVSFPDAPGRFVLLPTGAGQPKTLALTGFDQIDVGAWLPDAKGFIFSAREMGKRGRVYRLDVEEGKPRPISPEGVGIPVVMTGAVSPDGRWFLGTRGPGKFFRFPMEGGEPRPIAGLEPEDWPFRWSSDGRSLYVRARGPRGAVTVSLLDPEDGRRRLWREIKPDDPTTSMSRLVMTADGRSYAYSTRRAHALLYVVDGLK